MVGVPAIFGMSFQAPNIGQKFFGYVDGAGRIPQTITTLRCSPGPCRACPSPRLCRRGYCPGRLDASTPMGRPTNHGDPDREACQQPGQPRHAHMGRPGAVHLAHRQRAARPDRPGDRGHHGAGLAEGSEPSRGRRGRAAVERVGDRSGHHHRWRGGRDALRRAAGWEPVPNPRHRRATRLRASCTRHRTPSSSTTAAAAPRTPMFRSSSSTLDARAARRSAARYHCGRSRPTILQALGLKPRSLDAVRLEGTKRLPDDANCDLVTPATAPLLPERRSTPPALVALRPPGRARLAAARTCAQAADGPSCPPHLLGGIHVRHAEHRRSPPAASLPGTRPPGRGHRGRLHHRPRRVRAVLAVVQRRQSPSPPPTPARPTTRESVCPGR